MDLCMAHGSVNAFVDRHAFEVMVESITYSPVAFSCVIRLGIKCEVELCAVVLQGAATPTVLIRLGNTKLLSRTLNISVCVSL